MSKFVKKEPPSSQTINPAAPEGPNDSSGKETSTKSDPMHRDKRSAAQFAAGKCQYIKPNGDRCQANGLIGSTYCYFHDPELAKERQAARIKGGKERSRRATVLPPDTPNAPLATAADVTKLLVETINQVRRGELDSRVSNTVGFLTGYLLKAQQQEQVERRLERVESILERKWMNPNFQLAQEPEMGSFEFIKTQATG